MVDLRCISLCRLLRPPALIAIDPLAAMSAITSSGRCRSLGRPAERHPKAAAALEPADVLVDSMRGRSTTWTRIRVNLTHVPEAERPAQGALDPDYDPWAEYAWPDRAGQLERAQRRKRTAD